MEPVDRYTCEHVFERLDEFIDRELTADEMRLVQEHLEVCAWCIGQYEFNKSLLLQVKEKVQRITAPPGLLERISAALDREDGALLN
jgi:anti-sigma factor (TIGR02949 family)